MATQIIKYNGKRIKAAYQSVNIDNLYQLNEALELLKSASKVKFDESVEVAVHLGVDPRHSDQMVRGVVSLPHGTGKTVRVAVFAQGEKAKEAEKAGADIVGAEDLVEKIKAGEINFDRCIATPDMMQLVGQVAKILGPKGLMPNPKLGTVTADVAGAINAAKKGQIEYKVDKAGIIHAGIGKVSFAAQSLAENLSALLNALSGAKPSGAKGTYFQRASITTTMGPGLKLNLQDLVSGHKGA